MARTTHKFFLSALLALVVLALPAPAIAAPAEPAAPLAGRCLSEGNLGVVFVNVCMNTGKQRWTIEGDKIRLAGSSRCLSGDGTSAGLNTCMNTGHQRWLIQGEKIILNN
ncbi:ricin-type beta-trefoil lectin domain protein [Streptomyces sp. NPDC047315]|uniref:ricin-type beta-trefoil lectin domain protein n=1 Tax=Streptomyces sp. NPDC047315 TaxID=3155142 RepID=UPI0033C7A812